MLGPVAAIWNNGASYNLPDMAPGYSLPDKVPKALFVHGLT